MQDRNGHDVRRIDTAHHGWAPPGQAPQPPVFQPAPPAQIPPPNSYPAGPALATAQDARAFSAPPSAASPTAAAAARGEPDEPGTAGETSVTLSRPYTAFGETVQRVRFRKPTTKDLRKNGYPLRNAIGNDGRIAAIEEMPDIAARYISALSDPPLPPSTVDSLDLKDFAACSAVIVGFFMA